MPIVVNGEIIPQELIREEARRAGELAQWRDTPDSLEKRMQLREVAERLAIERLLWRQEADKDPRPIDPELVAAQVRKVSASQSCRVLFDEGPLARQIEGQLRLERTIREWIGELSEPSEQEIASCYKARRQAFQLPDIIQAAHIVKHIDELQSEGDARAGIEAALAELERGEPFAAVADRYSDCKGNGGDLGSFERGVMVEEFDEVVFAMQPGERSPIFRTPLGLHIAEVRSKTVGGRIAPLSEARDSIIVFLKAWRREEARFRASEQLRAQAKISRVSSAEARQLASERRAG